MRGGGDFIVVEVDTERAGRRSKKKKEASTFFNYVYPTGFASSFK